MSAVRAAFCLLLSACAVPVSATNPPTRAAPLGPRDLDGRRDLDAARRAALHATTVPFSAQQHVRLTTKEGTRESASFLYAWPGEAYRMRVLGPFMVALFDVQVRCGRFRVDMQKKDAEKKTPVEGALAEAARDVPYFPVAALAALFTPLGEGVWQGDRFVSRDGAVEAVLDPRAAAFAEYVIRASPAMRVQVDELTALSPGVFLPKRLSVALETGVRLEIVNDALAPSDTPPAAMTEGVRCPASG